MEDQMTAHSDGRLAGKVAIVTGAGSRADGIGNGNGRATCITLARQGAKITLVDQVADWVERTRQMIEAETVKAWGRLDILVNNVGISGPSGTAVEVDPDEWDTAMQVNVKSMMLMAKYAIPEMIRTGAGAIVNIASYAGLFGGHPGLLYPTSKGAVVNLTRAMAAHHAKDGIRVNAIAPGMVYTPMVYSGGMSEDIREARKNRSLLKVEGTGWDIGNGVLYLVSDEARWVTGIILPIDAGASAAPSASPSYPRNVVS
jgi:NAD(P)-dependent dehydrogenase (short-subunit alcohol dehydrogenase family)